MSKYLLEIGVEELPYRFITTAIEQLKKSFENLLNNNEINFDNIEVYGTPRRLTVIINNLDDKQKDVTKIIKGPVANYLRQDWDLQRKTELILKIFTPKIIIFMQKQNKKEHYPKIFFQNLYQILF